MPKPSDKTRKERIAVQLLSSMLDGAFTMKGTITQARDILDRAPAVAVSLAEQLIWELDNPEAQRSAML
jgi:hypothetical protein